MVADGYKQTDIGVIPEDWEVEKLIDNLVQSPKYGINAAAVKLERNLPVYIRITDISTDGYYRPSEKVGVDNNLSNQYLLSEGDIVLARTGASVGKSYRYRKSDGTLVYAGFLIKITPEKFKLNEVYLSQYLQTSNYWNWVRVMSMRSGQPGINGNEYGQLLIPIPLKQEQQAIATALSDTDELINSLEKLIAKKEAIKTGTMQELLTGKKRLDGFSGEWEEKTLLELFEITAGKDLVKSQFSEQKDEKYKYPIYANSIFNDGIYGYSTFSENDLNSITVSARGMLGVAFYRAEPYVAIGRLIILKPRYKLNCYYITQVINLCLNFVNESTSVPQLTAPQISKYTIRIPGYKEQQSVATILSDMDSDIATLKTKLSKVKAIKEGMMQELLTGKTRLLKAGVNNDT